MNSVQLYVRVLSLLGPDARLGFQLVIGNILLAMAQFAEPVLFGSIVDSLAGSAITNAASSWGALASLLGAWIGFGLFIIACGALIALFAGRLAHRRRQAVLADYFEHVLQLPLKRHGGVAPGQLMKLMLTGTDILWALWLALLREHLAAFVSLFVLLPLMLFLNWQLASIVIALTVAFAFLTALTMRKTETLQGTVEDRYTELAARASDAVGRVALVQSFSRIDVEVAALRDLTARLLNAQMPVLSWWAAATVLARTTTIVAMLTILPCGIWLHFRGQASIGEILAFMGIAALVLGRQEQAVGLATRVRLDAPRLREFFGVLDTAPAVRDRLDAVDPGRAHGLVEFKDVSFSFDGKRSAVADLDFTALPGQIVALVGAAGAGKSTVLALLHRDFDPQSGAVTIDGMDIRGITLSALRRNIGVVFPETPLFNRPLAENLQIAKPDATEEELRAACERAQAADLLARDSEGLAAGVGERGELLSDDERQRLAIARVFLKDPPILILDEATGATDAAAEAKVHTALDEVMKGRTTLVIAHRRATLRNAQRILVFDNGRIVETGTYDELMRRRGHFAALAATFGATRSKPAATGS